MKPNTALRISNIEGLSLLQKGKTQAAREMFEYSIESFVSSLEVPKLPTNDDGGMYLCCSPVAAVPLNAYGFLPEYALSPDNAFHVYTKCFEVLHLEDLDAPQRATVASALIFNVAQTYHFEFLASGIIESLRSAGSFYRKALDAMIANVDIDHSDMDATKCALLMAIYNNMGHCSAHVFNEPYVALCRKQVRDLLMNYWEDVDEGSELCEDFSFFYSNLLCCHGDDNVILKISPAA